MTWRLLWTGIVAAGVTVSASTGPGVSGAWAQAETARAEHAIAETDATGPWSRITIPTLHDFKPPQPKRIKLDNGILIFLSEDHELPFINGTILIRGGSRDEPAAKVGLVSLYGDTWRTSGTATLDGDALDDELEAKAAHIETNGGMASTSMTWSSLKGDFDPVFRRTLELLLKPAFKADKLDLAKEQMNTNITRRNDDASSIAGREAQQLVYGKSSPYARRAEFATVAAVTLADMQAWHDRTLVPDGMIVAVSGDFNSAEMEAKLRSAFGGLKKGPVLEAPKVAFAGPKPGVYFVEKDNVNQSTVYLVGLGTERKNPDLYALTVMNEVFSGGFGSRVMQDVRTKLGLAYSVGGSYGAQYDHPGMFRVGAGTKSASTVAATKAMMDEIGRLKTEPPTPEELKKAKDGVLNSFIFNYDSPDKTLAEQMTLAFYGYPADFLEKYKTGIERVTSADVSRVANKYIDMSRMATVVVGNSSQIQPGLSELGKVTTVDVSIPGAPPGGVEGPGGPKQ